MIPYVKKAVLWSTFVSVVIAPIVLLAGEAAFDSVHVGEILAGTTLGGAFFAISGITGIVLDGSVALKKALVMSYALKVVLLVLAALIVSFVDVNRGAFALAILSAACSYLVVQTGFLARKRLPIDLDSGVR